MNQCIPLTVFVIHKTCLDEPGLLLKCIPVLCLSRHPKRIQKLDEPKAARYSRVLAIYCSTEYLCIGKESSFTHDVTYVSDAINSVDVIGCGRTVIQKRPSSRASVVGP